MFLILGVVRERYAIALDALLARHRANTEDATDRLWRLLNLQLWGEIFITGRRERVWDGLLPQPAPAV